MTYLEKFLQDHPNPEIFKKWFGGKIEDVISNSCPSSWGYKDCPVEKCNPHSYCKACWNRTVPEPASWIRGEDGIIHCGHCGIEATYIKFGKRVYTEFHITPFCPWCGEPMNPGIINKGVDA